MALDLAGKAKLAEEMKQAKYDEVIQANKIHLLEKNRFRNLERCINYQRREREVADAQLRTKENDAFREKQIDRTEALAVELDKIKRDEFRKMKMRQALRVNCNELRELETKLRQAYVAKELTTQLAENEAKKLEEKLREKEEAQKLQNAWITLEQLHYDAAKEEIEKKAIYKQELQDQMIINEKRKRHRYDESLTEKKMIDDIVQRIHAEDERDREEKWCKMQKTKQEMDAFRKAQQIWKNRERDEIERENHKIRQYIMDKAIEMQSREAKKNELEAVKAALTERIAKELKEEEAKKREKEEIMQELYEEQQKQKVEQQHRASIEKARLQGIETRKSLLHQMLERQEKIKRQAEEDAKYKEALLVKIAEDTKLEQLSAQKRRMKMLENRREVEKMMLARRQKHAEEMQLMMRVKEEEEKEEAERQRIIEEERLIMLKEHVKNVVGFLPKGLLRPDDLPHLGSDLVDSK